MTMVAVHSISVRQSGNIAARLDKLYSLYSPCRLFTVKTESERSKTKPSRRPSRRDRLGSQQQEKHHQESRKKILFQSLGCPRNFVDTEVMLGVSVAKGDMDITQNIDEADVVVVNTCGFLESAREESRNAIQNMLSSKRPNSKLLVTGCMVNLKRQQDEILNEFPGISSVMASGEIDSIVDIIRDLDGNESSTYKNQGSRPTSSSKHLRAEEVNEMLAAEEAPISRRHRKSFLEAGETPRFLATPPHYAYLKIAEGCRKQCSFCIIPKLKGRLQSKPVHQIVDEFQAILQHGTAKEVILIAQDLGDYGKDWQSRRGFQPKDETIGNDSKKSHLTRLLESILASMDQSGPPFQDLEDPFWIRLLYLYPDEITPDLMELMERDTRIARYVDLPIQHSHNDILKAMRRKTSGDQIRQIIQQLRARLPDICIRTSLMVGFPGETEDHFQHLLDFIREQKLDHVGVFVYSNEEMAYSSRLDDHVPENVKQERYCRLMEAQWHVVEGKHKRWMKEGKQLRVVIEGLHEEDSTRIVGRHAGQCPDIDGQVLLEGHPNVFAGERYWVEITGYDGHDLIGRVLEGSEKPRSNSVSCSQGEQENGQSAAQRFIHSPHSSPSSQRLPTYELTRTLDSDRSWRSQSNMQIASKPFATMRRRTFSSGSLQSKRHSYMVNLLMWMLMMTFCCTSLAHVVEDDAWSACSHHIPATFEASFGSYPNFLNVSEKDRQSGLFHPVILYHKHLRKYPLPVSDNRSAQGLASTKEIQRARRTSLLRKCKQLMLNALVAVQLSMLPLLDRSTDKAIPSTKQLLLRYSIGKYDENRLGMYSSQHFDNLENTIDGFGGRRTVHLGIDLSAPVGTPVHSIADGVVHSVGYNVEHGDYGYVIVIEHSWYQQSSSSRSAGHAKVWALYGHLDRSTIHRRSRYPGAKIAKGQVIGRVGDIFENGGWKAPHVHFQLSLKPPDQPHDMPGASSVDDRTSALLQYPDPRYVLGPLY